MNTHTRLAALGAAIALAGGLAACAAPATSGLPPPGAPSAVQVQPDFAEYGRITQIEIARTQERSASSGVAGTLIGGVVGGVIGHQIGGGSGRDAATVLGAAGGALAGNSIDRNNSRVTENVYRVSVRMDGGTLRAYELLNPGELRVGDRVLIQNGQIIRA